MTHYLDHAATTPARPEVLDAWMRAARDLADHPGNPSSLHGGGRRARLALDEARDRIAAALGAEQAEVIFTSGATESDALAVAGGARGVRAAADGQGAGGAGRRRLVLVGGAEHDAVLEQGEVLRREGFAWGLLPIDEDGVAAVSPEALVEAGRAALDPAAELKPGENPALVNFREACALVSLGLVSSEVGTVQPVQRLVETVYREFAGESGIAPDSPASQLAATRGQRPLIHTDAAQAIGLIPVDFHALGVDLLSLGGHKLGAPVGVGALLARRGVPLTTDRPGGGHERGIRSGTPDVAGAVALACAIDLAVAGQQAHWEQALALRDHLLRGVAGLDYEVRPSVNPAAASPSIIHLRVPTRHPEALLMAMDRAGIHVSAGSACHAGVTRPSAVMMRMGHSENDALGVLRISTGVGTTTDDIDAFIAALPDAIAGAQRLDALERPR
ncbi:MAG: cysteine desulfurase family protein [Actinomycetaceae bacterium]|nr:cysteine desulfurase family protein [Actinomycetaceae bacterium]